MSKILTLLAALLFAVVLAPRESHAVAIDPIAGATGDFTFDLGDTTVAFPYGGSDPELTFTLASASTLDISVQDCCISGDVFSLIVDGSVVAWGSTSFPSGLFAGSIIGLALSAGAHTIDFGILSYCCRTAEGGYGTYSISGTASAVPLPGAAILLLTGLGAIGGLSLRRRKAA